METTLFLLDKNILRHLLGGIVRSRRREPLLWEQAMCLASFQLMTSLSEYVLVTAETYNLINLPQNTIVAVSILPDVRVLIPGKYLRRWARRLRSFGFSPEDAKILAYACFGVEQRGKTLGANMVVTLDGLLIRRYTTNFHAIASRFRAMITHLPFPYSAIQLPNVLTPQEVLDRYNIS